MKVQFNRGGTKAQNGIGGGYSPMTVPVEINMAIPPRVIGHSRLVIARQSGREGLSL